MVLKRPKFQTSELSEKGNPCDISSGGQLCCYLVGERSFLLGGGDKTVEVSGRKRKTGAGRIREIALWEKKRENRKVAWELSWWDGWFLSKEIQKTGDFPEKKGRECSAPCELFMFSKIQTQRPKSRSSWCSRSFGCGRKCHRNKGKRLLSHF